MSYGQDGEEYMFNVLRCHIMWLYICVHVSYCMHFLSAGQRRLVVTKVEVGGSRGIEF